MTTAPILYGTRILICGTSWSSYCEGGSATVGPPEEFA